MVLTCLIFQSADVPQLFSTTGADMYDFFLLTYSNCFSPLEGPALATAAAPYHLLGACLAACAVLGCRPLGYKVVAGHIVMHHVGMNVMFETQCD